MWTSDTMTLGESLTVSALGISVVLTALITLAIITILFSKNLALLGIGNEGKIVLRKQNEDTFNNLNEEEYAVLLCAVSEEINIPLEKFKIKEIKEIKY